MTGYSALPVMPPRLTTRTVPASGAVEERPRILQEDAGITASRSGAAYNHYSLLRTIEDGLGSLGRDDSTAAPIEDVFQMRRRPVGFYLHQVARFDIGGANSNWGRSIVDPTAG